MTPAAHMIPADIPVAVVVTRAAGIARAAARPRAAAVHPAAEVAVEISLFEFATVIAVNLLAWGTIVTVVCWMIKHDLF